MRTLIVLIFLLPAIFVAGQPAVVSIKAAGAPDKTIVLQPDRSWPQASPEKHTFPLSGNAELKLELQRGALVSATADTETLHLFLEPGDDLVISMEAATTPLAVAFSGKAAANNRMLLEFVKKFHGDFNPATVKAAIEAATSVDMFEAALFDQRMKQMRFVKEYADKKSVSPAFSEFLNNQISFNYFGQLLQYSLVKSDDPTGLKAQRLPDIMLSEMNTLPLMDERDMNSPAYRGFLRNYIRYQTSAQNSFVKFTDYADMLERGYSYALRFLTGEPFSYWLSSELFDFCDKTSPETVQKLYKALTQADAGGSYLKPVTEKCAAEIAAKVEKKEKISVEPEARGKKTKTTDDSKKSQPFTLLDLKGEKVYLEDFRGKVLYVDFWASWCGPCRQQFPYARDLHKMLSADHQKQVVFLYISIDNSEDTWKKAIEKNGIHGFNTISPGGWSSSAASHFGVSSIPRYMLIDKNGNVADPNAKRPSSGQEIINDIVRLIKE